jgi:hypothetical protein
MKPTSEKNEKNEDDLKKNGGEMKTTSKKIKMKTTSKKTKT